MCELDAILTPRQLEIAVLVVRGFTNKEIANKLGIAKTTVNHHMCGANSTTGIFHKLGIKKDRQIFKALYDTHYIDEFGLKRIFEEN